MKGGDEKGVAKANTPPQTTINNTLKSSITIWILTMTTTCTSDSLNGFWQSTSKTSNYYNFCKRNSIKAYFGALKSPFARYRILNIKIVQFT